MSRLGAWLGAVVALAGVAVAPARAQERVLVLEQPGAARPGLVQALRIQLSGLAEVEATPAPPGAATESVGERIRKAGELAERRSALLAVWVEGEPDEPRVVAYVVGRRAGRALVEVVEVPGGAGPDTDRSVALKVRDVADAVVRARRAPGGEPALIDPPAPVRPAPASPAAWGVALELGVSGAPMAGTSAGQWGVVAGGGATLHHGGYAFELLARLRVAPAVSFASGGDTLELWELAPGLWLAGRARGAGWQAGVGLGAWLRLLEASGQTAAGADGDEGATVASLGAAAEGRVELAPSAWLFLRAGVEASPHRQRFAVNAAPLADLGHLRPVLELGLAFAP